jgi:hypothetical protein
MNSVSAGRLAIVTFVAMALQACSTVTAIPMRVVSPEPAGPQIPKKVLLVVDDALRGTTHSSSQLAVTWTYPLGEVLPGIIEKTMSESFTQVTLASDASSAGAAFDLVVTPHLSRFEVVVPATVLSASKTTVGINYRVRQGTGGSEFTLSAVGTQALARDHDKVLLERIAKEIPEMFVFTSLSGGRFITVPDYNYQAARDATVAVLHCIDDLNRQLRAAAGSP